MLFEKIRRTQKPVFIFLGAVFALSFVFLGVGSGVGGVSLGNLIGGTSGSSASVSGLLDKVHKDPKNATAWLQLGDAYQAQGDPDPALGAYQQYLQLRPKDTNTIALVAGLYETRAQKLQAKASYWQGIASQYQSVSNALPPSATKLASAFPSPLVTSLQQPLQQKQQLYQQQAQGDLTQAVSLWKRAIQQTPDDVTFQQALLRDSLNAQDYSTAYGAVQQILKLDPTTPEKKQLEQLEAQLKPLAQIKTAGGSSGATTP
ncbi:MAG TPA: tetratricopeptide repeat protein [Gaiellales bacterium]|jgi:tetratricopeptide (TPR) repeat protein